MNGRRDSASLRASLRVYGVTPDSWNEPPRYRRAVADAAAGGMTMVQYRAKDGRSDADHRRCARAVVEAAREAGIVAIINDLVWLVEEVDADGVHVGVDDAAIESVRRDLSSDRIVGASAPSVGAGLDAMGRGADYLGVGAIFDASPSKSDASAARGPAWIGRFREERALREAPIVAIGGIDRETAASCIRHGADGVALIRGVFLVDDIAASARALRERVDMAIICRKQ